AGFKGNDVSLHAEAWPDDWLAVTATHRIKIDDDHTLQFQVSEVHRPDRGFYGIGPSSLQSDLSRYGIQRVDGSAAYEWRFWRSSRIETMAGVRDVSVFNGHYGYSPNVT